MYHDAGQQNIKFKQTLLFEVGAKAEEMVDDLNITTDHDQHLAFSVM
jgi:putative salt-induced outer membrane protein YdiY